MKKILAIDDSQFNLLVVQNALEKEYTVITKSNAKDGIEYARANQVDLILLDIEMPEIDGISAMKVLKKNPRTANIPIIFLTGLSDHEVEKTCLDLGARDFITKPFNEPVMQQRIRMVLELEDLRHDLLRQVKKKTEEMEKLTAQLITSFVNSKDPLTGLWSLSYMAQTVNSEVGDFDQKGALVVLDMDNFRVLNDAMGYKMGNQCLEDIGEAIVGGLGMDHVAARAFANQFVIFMPEVESREEAEKKIKKVVSSIEVTLDEKKFFGLTVSAGATLMLESGNNFDSLYCAAESALHKVKTNGKNAIGF